MLKSLYRYDEKESLKPSPQSKALRRKLLEKQFVALDFTLQPFAAWQFKLVGRLVDPRMGALHAAAPPREAGYDDFVGELAAVVAINPGMGKGRCFSIRSRPARTSPPLSYQSAASSVHLLWKSVRGGFLRKVLLVVPRPWEIESASSPCGSSKVCGSLRVETNFLMWLPARVFSVGCFRRPLRDWGAVEGRGL